MAKIYLQLETKNFSLHGNRIEIESDIIPRVGEIIDAYEYLGGPKEEVRNYIVASVIYKLTNNGFVPYITARQWWKGYRHQLLQERGWLVPENDITSYDEDDPAQLEKMP
jgi:hypothetical protein